MLKKEQIHQFHTFGFLLLENVFSADELALIDDEFARGLAAAYPDEPFDGSQRHWTPMLGESTPFFANLLEDPRLCDVAEQLYGDDAIGILADANRYVGDTGWHADTGSFHQFGVKFAFYLEPVAAETGALRVIPGSHAQPLHDELKQALPQIGLPIQDVPAFVCQTTPGDVVAFDLRLWHGSHGGSDDRRMCTCVYYNNPTTPEQEEATRWQAKSHRENLAHFHHPGFTVFDPHWLSNPGGSPKRQRWIDRLRDFDFVPSDSA